MGTMGSIAIRSVFIFAAACAFSPLAASRPAHAHALAGSRVDGASAVVLEFAYSSGETPAYAAIEVYGPDDARVEFQNGRTDRRGRFAFVPDKPGLWRAVVADNMGHRVETPVAVVLSETGMARGAADDSRQTAPMALKAILGASLLLNAGALLSWITGRGKRRATENAR